MSPEENFSYPPSLPDDNQFKKRLRLLLTLAIVLVIVVVVFAILGHKPAPKIAPKNTVFSITSAVPSGSSVTTQTSSMAVYFNMPIKAGSATVTSNPSIVTGTSINGNTLTISLVSRTLVSTKKYTITINSLSSTTGKRLAKHVFSFTPTFAKPTTSGGDALISIGISTDQLNSLFSYISQFDPWAQNVIIDQPTIKHYLEDPSDAWSPWAVSFFVTIDGNGYNVVGAFNNTESIQVTLTNPANGQEIFTAGSPGSF